MSRDFITFRSITPAQRAQRLLRQGGVETILQRTPRQLEQLGCGYCLRLRRSDREIAIGLLQQASVPFKRVFTQENGTMEEVLL